MQGPELAKKLFAMMHGDSMIDVPIWALTASDTTEDREAWKKAGVTTILLKPLRRETLVPLIRPLQPSDPRFYIRHDVDEHAFPVHILEKLPDLTREMARQINTLTQALSRQATQKETSEAAHAVKSAALTLGYTRLAACMDAFEHALRNGAQISEREDIAEIEHLLQLTALLLAARTRA